MFFPAVETAPMPRESQLWQFFRKGDFIDGYRVAAPYSPQRATEIAMKFPIWVYGLLAIRQIVMWPFGLKGKSKSADRIAIFPVTDSMADEMILGFDDQHLDFRIGVMARDGYIHCATWVHRHNWLGRAYLRVVMPFHILITKQMLARVARHAKAGQP